MRNLSAISLLIALIVPFCLSQDKVPITLDDVLGQGTSYGSESFGGTWSTEPGRESVIEFTRNRNLMALDVSTNITTTLVDASVIQNLLPAGTTSFSLSYSPDRNFVLITRNPRKLWRHSSFARFYIHQIGATGPPRQINPPGQADAELQIAVWASTGSALAFVHANDVYYISSADSTVIHTITTSGGTSNGMISNGHTDWVYEEEMFGSGRALWFSPDSRYLAFISFDDSNVDRFQYPIYGEPGSYFENLDNAYPHWMNIAYPKVGRTNPTWALKLVDTSATTPTSVDVTYTDDASENRHYIATMVWSGDNRLILVTLDRHQIKVRYHICTANVGSCNLVYSFNEDAGWIDVYNPRPHSTQSKFLTLLPQPVEAGSTERYQHLVLVDTDTGLLTQITSGRISVINIIAWNEAAGIIYFTGTGLLNGLDPSESHVYSISDDGNLCNRKHSEFMTLQCTTCTVKNSYGEDCRANSASFSSAFTFMLHSCSGPNPLEVGFRSVQDPNDLFLVVIDNLALRDKLAHALYPTRNDTTITIGQGANEYTTKARLLLPADFDPNKKYPLFISVYAGPSSLGISQGFTSVDWGVSLVSDRQVIYGFIDGRGSARQSSNYMFELYRRLGTVEIIDQIETTKKLLEMYSYLDSDRVAIWGWSYGGFATAHVLAQDDENIFKCGISVAPVTSYFFYDTIYTERYMRLPTQDDNLENYKLTDVTTEAEKFKNKTFFLVHGNADDNVHFQQSMILSRALEQGDVVFHQLSYPDEDHSIASPGMRRHLYHTFEDFLFKECFATSTIPVSGSNSIISSSILLFSVIILLAFNF